jgi:hypothetical protein
MISNAKANGKILEPYAPIPEQLKDSGDRKLGVRMAGYFGSVFDKQLFWHI